MSDEGIGAICDMLTIIAFLVFLYMLVKNYD